MTHATPMNPPVNGLQTADANPAGQHAGAPARLGSAPVFADLHLHTLFSDGTFTPEELAREGARYGLVAMALTDHDTVEGCARMARACQDLGIEFIAGSELTAEMDGAELHLIGYFLDCQNPLLQSELQKFQTARQNRIHEMVARLNNINIALRAETVFALANCRSPGRPHVGRALVQEGFCASLDEAFERFLKKNRPAWVPKHKISALDAIALIGQAGGLAVMAHPGLNRSDQIIPALVERGLDGIECFHTKHTAAMSEHYLRIAARFNLLVTGGSDCHGYSKGKPLIGGVKLPAAYLDKLRHAAKQRARHAAPPSSPPPSVHAPG
jgi:3',5'-nucleoside bisphosphate phosphatase